MNNTEDTLNRRKEFRSGFVKTCPSSRDQTQPSITEASIPVKITGGGATEASM